MSRRTEEESCAEWACESGVRQNQLRGSGPAPDSTLPQEPQLSHLWKNNVWSSFSPLNMAVHLTGLSNYITPTLSYLVFHHASVTVEFFGSQIRSPRGVWGLQEYSGGFHHKLYLLRRYRILEFTPVNVSWEWAAVNNTWSHTRVVTVSWLVTTYYCLPVHYYLQSGCLFMWFWVWLRHPVKCRLDFATTPSLWTISYLCYHYHVPNFIIHDVYRMHRTCHCWPQLNETTIYF